MAAMISKCRRSSAAWPASSVRGRWSGCLGPGFGEGGPLAAEPANDLQAPAGAFTVTRSAGQRMRHRKALPLVSLVASIVPSGLNAMETTALRYFPLNSGDAVPPGLARTAASVLVLRFHR